MIVDIKVFREQFDTTIEDLAKLVGISANEMNDIENGKTIPSVDIALKIWCVISGLYAPYNYDCTGDEEPEYPIHLKHLFRLDEKTEAEFYYKGLAHYRNCEFLGFSNEEE